MYCKNCGSYNPNDQKTCSNCGASLNESDNERTERLVDDNPSVEKKSFLKSNGFYILIGVLLIAIGAVSFALYQLTFKKEPTQVAENNDQSNIESNGTENYSYEEESKKNPNSTSQAVDNSTSSSNNNGISSGIHNYKFVKEDVTWDQAVQRAKSYGGYLAHIDSQEEFDHVASLASQYRNQGQHVVEYFIGGKRDDATNYKWVNQEGYTYGGPINSLLGNWFFYSGEPSYIDGDINENVLSLMFLNDGEYWTGNDVPKDIIGNYPEFSGKVGYIVEY